MLFSLITLTSDLMIKSRYTHHVTGLEVIQETPRGFPFIMLRQHQRIQHDLYIHMASTLLHGNLRYGGLLEPDGLLIRGGVTFCRS